MISIHFIPSHQCILVHWVLFTPFGTNPGPYEPVMWGFNPYFWELPKTRPNSPTVNRIKQQIIGYWKIFLSSRSNWFVKSKLVT